MMKWIKIGMYGCSLAAFSTGSRGVLKPGSDVEIENKESEVFESRLMNGRESLKEASTSGIKERISEVVNKAQIEGDKIPPYALKMQILLNLWTKRQEEC